MKNVSHFISGLNCHSMDGAELARFLFRRFPSKQNDLAENHMRQECGQMRTIENEVVSNGRKLLFRFGTRACVTHVFHCLPQHLPVSYRASDTFTCKGRRGDNLSDSKKCVGSASHALQHEHDGVGGGALLFCGKQIKVEWTEYMCTMYKRRRVRARKRKGKD